LAERTLPITDEHRAALVRSLHRRIGPFWAEDLAQETLAAAWANPRTPDREPDLTRWLHAIARNLAASRLRADLPVSPLDPATIPAAIDDWSGDEWSAALETGMATLPPETRSAIALRYLDGLPQAEASARLGISEGALESRIQRGKRAIHRHIVTHDASTAVDLGLIAPTGIWIPTDIWCESCGRRHLEGMWLEGGGFRLDCPSCITLGGARNHNMSVTAPIATGLTRFSVAVRRLESRMLGWANEGMPPPTCPFCAAPSAIVPESVDGHDIVQFALRCTACSHPFWMSAHGVAGSTIAYGVWRRSQQRVSTPEWPITIRRPGETRILVQWRSHTNSTVFEALVDPALRQPIEAHITDGRGVVLR
jgi:RNA polymerase sigma-70 factor (ECF subfamily)